MDVSAQAMTRATDSPSSFQRHRQQSPSSCAHPQLEELAEHPQLEELAELKQREQWLLGCEPPRVEVAVVVVVVAH